MLYHEKVNFMPIMISPTFLLYVGIVQFLHSFFIISVQTNNPGDLANKLSLIARLLKHCTVTPPSSHVKNSKWQSTIFFYWTHSRMWKLQMIVIEKSGEFGSIYIVISCFRLLHLRTLKTFTSERIFWHLCRSIGVLFA